MTPKATKQITFQCDDAGSASCNVGTSLCNNSGMSVTGPATLNLACNLPDLEANETKTRHLFFLVDTGPDTTGDTHNNLSTVGANEDDTVLANDSEGEPTSVRVKVDLGVTKTASIDPVDINEPFDWNILVVNNGPGDSDNMSDLADTLPAGMELTGPPVPSQGTCTGMAGSTAFTCALGTIVNGANATVTAPARVTVFPAGGTLANMASVSSFGIDTVPGNDMVTTSVTVQKSSIAGTVFADADDDGVQGGGELGIPGVQMTLTGTDAFGNPVNIMVTTDANGDYIFDNLPPSDATGYSITETQPLGFVDGLESIGGAIIPGSRSTDTIMGVVLGSNTALIDHDFADIPNTSISGVVWADENDDGVRDPTEIIRIGMTQITLTGIDDLGNPVNLVTMTAADGSYSFNMLRAGTYTVTETQPASWADGMESVGSAGGTVGNDVFTDVMLGVNEMAVDYDFGETGSSLSGFVYNDLDGDGINDPMDPGIPGVTITIMGTDLDGNPINRVVLTGPDGSYSFSGLPQPDAGGYTVTETQPPGVTDGIDTIGSAGGTVGPDMFSNIVFPGPGTNATNYNFGEGGITGPARVSGRVFFDGNHNRMDDENSGQGGWTVQLVQRPDPNSYDNVTIIATTTTAPNGDYAFDGLSPGDYEVIFRHPDGGAVYGTPESTGGAGNTDFGTIRGITLVAGSDVMAQNLPIDPSGVVYDAVTRAPVPGAVVTFTGPPGFDSATQLVGGVGNVTQVTGATGQYQYLLLVGAPIGDYTITVTAPITYLPAPSSLIPACNNVLTVAPLPDPALVQDSSTPPPVADLPHDPNACAATTAAPAFAGGLGTTQYYFTFTLTPLPGGSANLINNHIPLDPITGDALTIVKTAGLVNVSRGDLVPFTLTIRNNLQGPVTNINIYD